jgi:MFS superfamily sulfate permease-like transporter
MEGPSLADADVESQSGSEKTLREKKDATVKPPHFDFSGITPTYVIKECLLGATIGFAQIPESVAFAYLANIKPPLALHAAWMVGLICSLFGGRPGMVNGATGAFAAIIGTFLPKPDKAGGNGDGIELLFPSVIVAGIFMWIVAATGLARFILLLPSPVMIGFCNGLAVVIGLAQTHPFFDPETHEPKEGMELFWMLTIMIVAMVVMEFVPKIPLKILKIIPSSLLAILSSILIQNALVIPTGSHTDTIGDVSKFTSDTAFPIPFFVEHPGYVYDYSVLKPSNTVVSKIIQQGFLLAVVGTIESLMTSEVVESFTKTPSEGDKTVAAMGFGNVLSGFFGGMGGNAMIGLSTINVLNGGQGRLAPTCTALIVMVATMGAYEILNVIPVAALSGIMIVVVLHTFKWFSVPIILSSLMP